MSTAFPSRQPIAVGVVLLGLLQVRNSKVPRAGTWSGSPHRVPRRARQRVGGPRLAASRVEEREAAGCPIAGRWIERASTRDIFRSSSTRTLGCMVSVLVAFATRHGSTREVADAIADVLRADAATVDVRAAWSVRASIAGRDLIILGAPLYSGRWLPAAHRFLKRHRKDLQQVPIAVFALGPRERTDKAWSRSRSQLEQALAKHQWLNPAATALFGGADELGRSTAPARDLRDWTAIRAWAAEVSQHAQLAEWNAGGQ